MEMTKGRGPDRYIDAVGTEAHAGGSIDSVLDRANVALFLGSVPGTDRVHVLRETISVAAKAGLSGWLKLLRRLRSSVISRTVVLRSLSSLIEFKVLRIGGTPSNCSVCLSFFQGFSALV